MVERWTNRYAICVYKNAKYYLNLSYNNKNALDY